MMQKEMSIITQKVIGKLKHFIWNIFDKLIEK